jgi:hypothetical protein
MADTINLQGSSLVSRAIRNVIGERTVDIYTALRTNEPGDDDGGGAGGVIGLFRTVLGIGRSLVGFLVRSVGGFVRFLLRNLWTILVEAAFEIANFDWAQTDDAIRSQINANNLIIAGSLGDLFGTGSVWLATLGLSLAAAIKFPVIAGEVALRVAEEGGDEIRGQLMSFLTVTRNSVTRNLILGGFLTARRLRLFGLSPITTQQEPWTIAEAIEERVEAIDNDFLRAFVDNFLESATEAIIEAGYVVSYAIDDYYQAQKLAQRQIIGENRGVIITPDNRTPEENFVVKGSQNLIKPTIQNAIATHRLIYNRDVGQIVGEPAGDWRKAGYQRRILTLVFKSKDIPPYVTVPGDPDSIKTVTITIPDADTGLTWERIKRASRRWTWGKFKATANLENGRKLRVNGATADEAEDKLREFLELQSSDILTLSVSEEKDRHPYLRKTSTVMHPAYGDLLIRRVVGGDSGNTDQTGQSYQNEIRRFDLWPENEPPDFETLP